MMTLDFTFERRLELQREEAREEAREEVSRELIRKKNRKRNLWSKSLMNWRQLLKRSALYIMRLQRKCRDQAIKQKHGFRAYNPIANITAQIEKLIDFITFLADISIK